MKDSNANGEDCRRFQADLMEAFDEGRLGGLDQSLTFHLLSCAPCRSEWERLVALSEGLKAASVPDPGSGYWSQFVPSLRQKMQENLSGSSPDLSWLPSFAMAAGVTLLMLLSPARISPPIWWSAEDRVSVAQIELSSRELAALDKALQQAQKQNTYLNEDQLQFIQNFSMSNQIIFEDPMEKLSTMSDEAIETFFERLKSRSFVRS